MSLDITFKEMHPVVCPHCGKVVKQEAAVFERGGGREWYPILESIGYYVPWDKRTEENDWYGKDMELTREQAEEMYEYIKKHDGIYGYEACYLIARSLLEGDTVVICADW